MKKVFLLLSIVIATTACMHKHHGGSMISGKFAIINEYGTDITQYCLKTLRTGGAYALSAETGSNNMEQFTCKNGDQTYRIKANNLSVNVASNDNNVNFGNVKITLNDDKSYSVTGGNGKLKTGNTANGWSKHDTQSIY